eukprot:XP_001701708.1 predicted protein [Chlamydomonas reinhardtii]
MVRCRTMVPGHAGAWSCGRRASWRQGCLPNVSLACGRALKAAACGWCRQLAGGSMRVCAWASAAEAVLLPTPNAHTWNGHPAWDDS